MVDKRKFVVHPLPTSFGADRFPAHKRGDTSCPSCAHEAELERQLADERARIDCATRDGWLSEDLECAGEDGPACWKHMLKEAQETIAALMTDTRAAIEEEDR